jgi:hypothetical protein
MAKASRAAKVSKGAVAAMTWDLVWAELCDARRSGDEDLVQAAEYSVRLYNARMGFPERSGL